MTLEKYNSIDITKINEFRETIGKTLEKTEKNPLINKKNEYENLNKIKQIKDDLAKTTYYMNEIKKLKEKEKLLKKMIDNLIEKLNLKERFG